MMTDKNELSPFETAISRYYDRCKGKEDIKEDPLEQARSNYKLGKSLYDQKAYPMAKKGLEKIAPGDKPSISKSLGNLLKKAMPSFFDK